MDMVVAAVDETVSAAVRETQVLASAVKREEEAARRPGRACGARPWSGRIGGCARAVG
jgi:hypothetical protein